MRVQKYLDPVIEEFTTGVYYPEVFRAKEEYFVKAGTVYEDDAEFEPRMSIFMDWYLFDRDLPGVDLPPIKYYFRKNRERFSSDELAIYKDLCSTVHSIFRMQRKTWNRKGIVIKDLFSGKKYVVTDRDITQGLSRAEVFEARVIPFQGTHEFSRGFCFHPNEVGSFILGEIKKVRAQDRSRHTKLILQLSAMKLKHLRFPQIELKHLYTYESKF